MIQQLPVMPQIIVRAVLHPRKAAAKHRVFTGPVQLGYLHVPVAVSTRHTGGLELDPQVVAYSDKEYRSDCECATLPRAVARNNT